MRLVREISLTEHERAIFRVLKAAAAHSGRRTTLRVAGGWVRDKLMGLESPDIDVTLDDCLGREVLARSLACLLVCCAVGRPRIF